MIGSVIGPQVKFCNKLHGEKYRLGGGKESYRESVNRIASALKDDDEHYSTIRDIALDMRFMYAGRIQAAVGAPHKTTALNCFASLTWEDSFQGIMQQASNTAETMRLGGGIGHDISTLRPKGDLIKGVQSTTDGPLAFLPIFHAVNCATSSTGNRRGAQIGVMRVDHPDIEAFIQAKQNNDFLTGFNLSVAITDEFMECMLTNKPFDLRWGGRVYKTIDPVALWEGLMRSTWDWAEPGVLFIDTVNRLNNLWYTETIATTNPCGEVPLPPGGACLLGSFNLAKYIVKDGSGPLGFVFDWDQFVHDIPPIVRAMDNVIDVTPYPLEAQGLEMKNKRRMGLGFMGLANAGEALGFEYGSPGFLKFENHVGEVLREEAYMASTHIAEKKGSFPLFDAELFLEGPTAKKLPDHVRHSIRKRGLRNSHLTSIAPTGTISLCSDNVSSGCEPVFALKGTRDVRMNDGVFNYKFMDYGYREFGVSGKVSKNVTAKEHIDVLITAANNVDSAVSKTCNVDGSMPWEDFKGIYQDVWEREGKGCTTFNADGKKMALLKEHAGDDKVLACTINEAGDRECS